MRFPGQRYDAASELNYNYFHDYDPRSGRYVQSDPIGPGGGISTYGNVRGNPISFVDPFGLAGGRVDLGDGYTGRVDQFNFRSESSFEVHVYNSRGNEVGVYGPDGWISKHGWRGAPTDAPSSVEARCQGIAEDFLGRAHKASAALDRAAERSSKLKKVFGPLLGPMIEAFYPSPNRVCDPVPGYPGCEDMVQ